MVYIHKYRVVTLAVKRITHYVPVIKKDPIYVIKFLIFDLKKKLSMLKIKIYIKIVLCTLFCCFSLLATSQNTIEKDSLSKYSFKELHDKSYAAKPDSLKALIYAKYRLKKALKNSDTLNIAFSYYILSSITNDTLSFTKYWRKIINNQNSNKSYSVIGNLELGDFYFHRGQKYLALKNYLKADKIAVKNNVDSLISATSFRLGILKSHNKEYHDAINHYKSSLKYFNKNINKNELNHYCSIMFNLSSAYKSLKLYDSAFFYNNKAYLLANKYKDSIIKGYANYNSGTILYIKREYSSAIDSIKKSLEYLKLDENYFILSNSFLKLGKAYHKINDKKNSLLFFKKVDSLFLITKNYYKSQKPAYKFLISHYKNKKNDAKQLEYIIKYIKVDSILNTRSKNISKNLTKNYDIPKLLTEKKVIENRLKSDLSTTKKWVIGIGTLAFLISLTLIHQTRKRKLYKDRFQELMNAPIQEVVKKEEIVAKKEQSIPKETIENILSFLQKFEKNHGYISHEITLSSLAKAFETNSKYLSQLINQNKKQSFNSYINQLRINYTVEKLKTDSTFRKFSIKAIAHEVGFNTTESFSKAFYKNTGIKPSFFIKELKK